MKTQFFLMSTVALFGMTVLTTSYAANTSEYLHFTRHRDSQGNLLMAPTQPQSKTSVIQKTMMPSQPNTFERRSTDWGMSAQEVKENEPVQPSWELRSPILADYEKRVAYHTQIEGIEAALTYTFYEDHLGQAKYVFEPQHDDAVEYVQDFHTVKNWISQSYGSPTSVQDIWLDTLYQYDQSLWGQAVLRGHLVMVAEWKQPGTDIVLMLDGGEDMIGLVADFASTTVVVPVSLAIERAEESIEEAIEETTIQNALPAEPMDDSNIEDIPIQETLIDQTGIEEHPSDTEVASQTPTELGEIEKMLNEAFPEMEPLEPAQVAPSMEKEGQELNLDPQASIDLEEMAPPRMDTPSMEPELPPVDGGMDDPLIEPSLEGQELNLDPQASIDLEEMASPRMDTPSMEPELPPVDGGMDDHRIEPANNLSQTLEHSNSNSSEKAAEGLEAMTSENAMNSDSADVHLMEDHANDHTMESEAELEGHHL